MTDINQLLHSEEMNNACGLIGNCLYNRMEPMEDKTCVNITELAEKTYNDNLTSIIAALVECEKHYDKKDIATCLQHYSEVMCAIGLLFAKASYLDY